MLDARSSVDSPRLRAMAGSAVVTIVLSSVSMKNAAATMSGMRRDIASGTASAIGGTPLDRSTGRAPAGSGSTCAADHVVYGIEVGDGHLPGCGTAGADRE